MNIRFGKFLMLVACLCVLLSISACGVALKHVPAKSLNGVSIQKPISIMVADIGDEREDEPFDRIGQGVSYWLPVSFYARDEKETELITYNIFRTF